MIIVKLSFCLATQLSDNTSETRESEREREREMGREREERAAFLVGRTNLSSPVFISYSTSLAHSLTHSHYAHTHVLISHSSLTHAHSHSLAHFAFSALNQFPGFLFSSTLRWILWPATG